MQTPLHTARKLDTAGCTDEASCVCERCQAIRLAGMRDGARQQESLDGHRLRAHAEMIQARAASLRERGDDERVKVRELQASGVTLAADTLFPGKPT